MPQSLTAPEFAHRIEPILAHELIHFRRGDTVLGVLQTAAQILWWFHPLIWWASREATRERERCCDEEAVAGLACEPGDYAQTLLDVLRSKRKLEPVFAQPGVRPVDITARRLEHIMQGDRRFHQRTPVWCWVCAGLAAALLLPGGGLVIEAGAASGDGDSADEVAFHADSPWSQEKLAAVWRFLPTATMCRATRTCRPSGNVKKGQNIKWTAKLGTSVYSSPIVAEGKIVIGSNNGAAYGARLPKNVDASLPALLRRPDWRVPLAACQCKAGDRASPRLASDWRFAPLRASKTGVCGTSTTANELVCLDLNGFYDNKNDGPYRDEPAQALGEADVIWKLDMMGELGVSQHNQPISSVTLVGDLVLAGTSHGLGPDHIQLPKSAPSFIAVNKNTGRIVWQDSSSLDNLVHGQWSSPAYGVIDGVGPSHLRGRRRLDLQL